MEKDDLEEAWAIHVLSAFDELVKTAAWGPRVYDFLSEESKQILHNMWVLEQAGYQFNNEGFKYND